MTIRFLQIGLEKFAQLSAYEMIRNHTDNMIRLYQQQPALLRFSGNYKTFINRRHTAGYVWFFNE